MKHFGELVIGRCCQLQWSGVRNFIQVSGVFLIIGSGFFYSSSLAQNHLEPVPDSNDFIIDIDTAGMDSIRINSILLLYRSMRAFTEYYNGLIYNEHSLKSPIRFSKYNWRKAISFTLNSHESGSYIVACNLVIHSWSYETGGKESLLKDSILISNKIRADINRMFQLAIEQIEKPDFERNGCEGTDYFFSYRAQEKIIEGKIFEPESGSLMYDLVKCNNLLFAYAFGRRISEKRISKRVEKMIIALEKNK